MFQNLFLINASFETGIKIPVTWNELIKYEVNMSFDELLAIINTSPESLGFSPKYDGTPYTKEDIINYIKEEYATLIINLNIMSEEELNDMYPRKTLNPKGTLILGGENSKFVINNGTNVDNMFGFINNFTTLVTPNEIGDTVTINLPYLYKNSKNEESVELYKIR